MVQYGSDVPRKPTMELAVSVYRVIAPIVVALDQPLSTCGSDGIGKIYSWSSEVNPMHIMAYSGRVRLSIVTISSHSKGMFAHILECPAGASLSRNRHSRLQRRKTMTFLVWYRNLP